MNLRDFLESVDEAIMTNSTDVVRCNKAAAACRVLRKAMLDIGGIITRRGPEYEAILTAADALREAIVAAAREEPGGDCGQPAKSQGPPPAFPPAAFWPPEGIATRRFQPLIPRTPPLLAGV